MIPWRDVIHRHGGPSLDSATRTTGTVCQDVERATRFYQDINKEFGCCPDYMMGTGQSGASVVLYVTRRG